MKKRLFEVEMWMWNPTVVTLRVEADGWESACDAAYTRLRDTREVFEEGAEYGERLDDLECWELTGARKIDADGVYKGTFEPYDRARGMFAVEFKRTLRPRTGHVRSGVQALDPTCATPPTTR